MSYNVVEAVEVTPAFIASRVAKETPIAWWVECSEGNSGPGAKLVDLDQLAITAILTSSTGPATS